jgi:ABC-type dipeptide/oligopeptide/nickel transport system permease component
MVAHLTSIGGYLGSFEISAQVNNENKILMAEDKYFDIVLDLIGEVETAIVPPFGYYTLDKNTSHTEEVLTEVNQLIGILDKPKFLQYFIFIINLCTDFKTSQITTN